MPHSLPSSVLVAVSDPKYASETALISALDNQDYLPESKLTLVREELERRGNDSRSSWERYE